MLARSLGESLARRGWLLQCKAGKIAGTWQVAAQGWGSHNGLAGRSSPPTQAAARCPPARPHLPRGEPQCASSVSTCGSSPPVPASTTLRLWLSASAAASCCCCAASCCSRPAPSGPAPPLPLLPNSRPCRHLPLLVSRGADIQGMSASRTGEEEAGWHPRGARAAGLHKGTCGWTSLKLRCLDTPCCAVRYCGSAPGAAKTSCRPARWPLQHGKPTAGHSRRPASAAELQRAQCVVVVVGQPVVAMC